MKDKDGSRFWTCMGFFYDRFYERFPPYQKLHQEIFKILKSSPQNSGCIIDAGCGTGLLSAELARQGYPVVGIDKSSGMLNRARAKREKGNLTNLLFREGDLNEKPELHGLQIQRILFIHSLYTLNHPQETLRYFSSFLPPGGEIIMCNPSRRLTPGELLAGGRSFILESCRQNERGSIFFILGVAVAMWVMNVLIQRKKEKIYYCWDEKEIEALLRERDFRVKCLQKSCIAGSHLLLYAIKES